MVCTLRCYLGTHRLEFLTEPLPGFKLMVQIVFFLKKKILTLLAKSVSNYAIENNIFDIDNAIFHKSFFSTIYSHGKNGKYP